MDNELAQALEAASANDELPEIVDDRPAAVVFQNAELTKELAYVRKDIFDQVLQALSAACLDLQSLNGGTMPSATSAAMRKIDGLLKEVSRAT